MASGQDTVSMSNEFVTSLLMLADASGFYCM